MEFLIFLIIFVIAISYVGLKLPTWRGQSCEYFVTKKLNQLDSEHYTILNDLMLPSKGNLETTQIDHTVVSNYGIFVLETKAHKGWIFGGANQKYWIQIIYRHKQKFYNPLRQNFVHLKAVESLIEKHLKDPIISFAVFPNAEKIKISGTDCVGCARDIIKKIKSYTNFIYSNEEKDKIIKLLTDGNIIDEKKRKEHNRRVKEITNEKEKPAEGKSKSLVEDLPGILEESVSDVLGDFEDRPRSKRRRDDNIIDDFF